MRVTYGIGKVNKQAQKSVLAIGVFDGVHVGHQALIQRAIDRARSIGKRICVLTFWPHPLQVVKPSLKIPLIISLEHRMKLLEQMGVDACVVVRFTKRFSQMSPSSFIKRYLLEKLDPAEIFVGDDFRFGHDRKGSVDYFKDAGESQGFSVNNIRTVPINRSNKSLGKVSSTLIRKCVTEGDLNHAQSLLGRPVSVMGKVVRGKAMGGKLGFPTANIKINGELLPPVGVYAVRVIVNQKEYRGMANIGYNPSFKNSKRQISLEVHIFNLAKNLYGMAIVVEFIKKIRAEKIFGSEKDLIVQLKKDELTVRQLFKSSK